MSYLRVTRKVGDAVYCSIAGKPLVTVFVDALLPDGAVRLGFEADRSVDILRDNARVRREGNEQREPDESEEINGNR